MLEWMCGCLLRYSHDCAKVGVEKIREVEGIAGELGVRLDGEGEMGGWVGGRVVLVQTDRPVGEWVPIAERVL